MIDETEDPADAAAALAKLRTASPPDINTALAKIRATPRPASAPTDENNQATPEELAAAEPEVGTLGAFGRSLATTGANIAQGIPGMEAVQAGARAGARTLASKVTSRVAPQGYREALSDIRDNTAQLPTALRVGERIAGALPLASLLPGSAAASGATIGGLEGLLNADPDQSLGARAMTGALGAGAGAVAGKGAEMLTTGARVVGATPAAKRLQEMLAERAKAATPLFNKALSEGQGRTGTPAVKAFLQKPDIAEIVAELKTTRKFQSTPEEAPEMLDAVYKVLSDRGAQIKKGLDSVSPTKPNIGRFREEDVRAAKDDALHAMSGGTSLPGPMQSYRPAVETYADHSGRIGALRRGADIVRTKLGPQMPTGKNLDRTTPEAFAKWADGASDAERKAAGEGMLGEIKSGFDLTKPRNSLKAIGQAPSLLRAGREQRQSLTDMLIQAGIISGDNIVKR